MCGIFGLYSQTDANVARQIFFALMGLQHRGQEAAGIAVSDGMNINYKKESGMINQIFREKHLAEMPGYLGIAHARYSTTANKSAGMQPYVFSSKLGPFAIAHNGEITGYLNAKQKLMDQGVCFFTNSDTELLAHIIARSKANSWEEALAHVIETVNGAYSLVVLTNEAVYAVRDPLGMRLLCLGQKGDTHYLASESCCLQVLGANFVREIPAGTLVRIDKEGCWQQTVKQLTLSTCAFEHVYFSRPDSIIGGRFVHETRQRIGEQLYNEISGSFRHDRVRTGTGNNLDFTDNCIVTGVPESATPMAIGFSQASGIPYNEVFAKNKYIHRTFIRPIDGERRTAVTLKFNPLDNNITGKQIILIDDSIVRGNTIAHLVEMLKNSGATRVHVLVGSPEVKYPCFMGIDMKTSKELICNQLTVPELKAEIKADTLYFLSLEGLLAAIGSKQLCTACWTGQYPKELEW